MRAFRQLISNRCQIYTTKIRFKLILSFKRAYELGKRIRKLVNVMRYSQNIKTSHQLIRISFYRKNVVFYLMNRMRNTVCFYVVIMMFIRIINSL